MIVGSLLLLVAGAGLLIAGLVSGNDSYLIGTIIASLSAAACLIVSKRGAKEPRRRIIGEPERSYADIADDQVSRDRRSRADRRNESVDDHGYVEVPQSRQAPRDEYVDIDVDTDGVPSDEPAEAHMSSVEAAALMRMDAEVMVIDGRPRFHLGGCVHLIGRDGEALPAYEAVELGFTPCSLCRPAQSLMREPARH